MYIHVLRYVKDIILHTYQYLFASYPPQKKLQIHVNNFLPGVQYNKNI